MPFKLDEDEYRLVGNHPTKFQSRYGRPNVNDVKIKYRSINIKDHLKVIHEGITGKNQVVTKIPKPKSKPNQFPNIDKKKVRTII